MAPKEDIQKAEIIELVNILCSVVIELNSLQSHSITLEEGKRISKKWINAFKQWGWVENIHEIKWKIMQRILDK